MTLVIIHMFFRYADDTTLMAESEEELTKWPLDESERRE